MLSTGDRALLLAALFVFIPLSSAYYVPGAYPHAYEIGEKVQGKVNSLKSHKTELPFEYYTLPFCKPTDEAMKAVKGDVNPGTILMGIKIEASPYEFLMMKNETGKSACSTGPSPKLTPKQVKNFQSKIRQEYWVNLVLDNLPVTVQDLTAKDLSYVTTGYPLGFVTGKKYYVYNHLNFYILVHPTTKDITATARQSMGSLNGGLNGRRLLVGDVISRESLNGLQGYSRRSVLEAGQVADPDSEAFMIVGFEVSPCSIQGGSQSTDGAATVCFNVPFQEVAPGAQIEYTYDVIWGISPLEWASRWDTYLTMPGGSVHWFSILNSVLVVLVMAVVCGMIIVRTVRRDLTRYEELFMDGTATESELKEDAGWKLVSGDVFRAPSNVQSLAVRVGSGFQILATLVVTMCFSVVGFLSPASRGSLLTALLVLYLLLAVAAGFGGVWLWSTATRSNQGWRRLCWKISLYFPGITFFIFTIVNMAIHHTGSTGAIPVGTYFALVAVWFTVSIPLTFVGGYFASMMRIVDFPTRTNQIPRHIPAPRLSTHPHLLFAISGLLPFGTLFIELYFVMSSMWMGHFYYLFGYLMLILSLTFLITIEISILCTYVQLCSEDYLWWWQSFRRGGCIALYLMAYAMFFLWTTLGNLTGFVSVFLYVCYMGILVWAIYLAMGSLGFLSSYMFTFFIFKSVKFD